MAKPSAASTIMPTPAPMPAFAPVERPPPEDDLDSGERFVEAEGSLDDGPGLEAVPVEVPDEAPDEDSDEVVDEVPDGDTDELVEGSVDEAVDGLVDELIGGFADELAGAGTDEVEGGAEDEDGDGLSDELVVGIVNGWAVVVVDEGGGLVVVLDWTWRRLPYGIVKAVSVPQQSVLTLPQQK